MRALTLGFVLALAAQVALLAALPWNRQADDSASQTIWLVAKAGGGRQDVMRGQYVSLTYDISDPARFVDSSLGSDDRRALQASESIYVVLTETEPGLWSGLRIVRGEPPSGLAEGQVMIRGEVVDRGLQINAYLRQEPDGSWAADSIVTGELPRMFDREQQGRALAGARVKRTVIAYRNIDSYFVPQNEQQRFKEDLLNHPQDVRAQVRVNEDGSASLLVVRVQDRTYDF